MEKEKLNFEIPASSTSAGRHPFREFLWIFLLVLLGIAIGMGIDILFRKFNLPLFISNPNIAVADTELLKKIALKLEENGLNHSSALAWKEYLNAADLENKDAALIWYRIGKLYQDAHDDEQALDGYYRSETLFAVDSIASEISLRTQECLESLGKFAAMRHDLTQRVSLPSENGASGDDDPVLAEIGTQKISASELDRRIEKNIERQIQMMAPYLPETERNQRKAELLKQFSTAANRKMLLNQILGEEILYRKAREDQLAQTPQIQDLLNSQEKSLLAGMVLEKAYADQINITPSDLETYYDANKEKFKKDDEIQAFDQVKEAVYQTLRSQKEEEIRQQLLNRLKDKYDVVIHQSALAPRESEKTAPAPPAASQTGTQK